MLIGFSVQLKDLESDEGIRIVKQMLQAGCNAIQVHVHPDANPNDIEALNIVKDFSYRTIHIPKVEEESAQLAIRSSIETARLIHAHDFTLHPNGIKSFGWLADEFGSQLNIENMDWQKDFGKVPEDLQSVFNQLPDAGWTFDVNHIKTNDPSMQLADQFYEKFKQRLRQYHLSGFGGPNMPHTLLADTKQNEIIQAIKDKTKPIIIESLGSQTLFRFQEELDYLKNFFDI